MKLIQPEDGPGVCAFNRRYGHDGGYRLNLDLIPEPHMGNRNASVVFLYLNPSFDPVGDPIAHRDPEYASVLRGNLSDDPARHVVAAYSPSSGGTQPGGHGPATA
jgi:hypothetical protein